MLALIPARGGSKGLPGKNIRVLNGIPLIAHTIEAAKNARLIDRIIVSTDDSQIADISKKYGAEVPFMRPSELAADNSLAIDAYIYTIDRLNSEFKENITEFAVLLPTSPLRTSEDIDAAIDLFNMKNADSIISYYETPHPLLWARKIDSNRKISNYFVEDGFKNRQDIEKAYMPNGAIYIFKYSILKELRTYFTENTYAYIMSAENSVDIDTELDFQFAEFLMGRKNG